jgi:toxin ParE1/3/4
VRRLLWSDDALDDFVEAIAFITRASPASADVVADRIDAAAEALREMCVGRPGRVSGTYEKLVLRTPYILSYLATPDAILILRVIHARRHWPEGTWPQ